MQIKTTGQGIWLLVIKRLQVFKWREAMTAAVISEGFSNNSKCTYFEAKPVIIESSEVYSLRTAVKILTKSNECSRSYTLVSFTMEFTLIVI